MALRPKIDRYSGDPEQYREKEPEGTVIYPYEGTITRASSTVLRASSVYAYASKEPA